MFFANASKLFSFFFSEKNDEDPILADFLKKMATAWDGCTAAQQLSCRSDWALLVQLCSQPCCRERLRENMEIRVFVGVWEVDADFAIAAIDMISGNKHVVNFCKSLTNKKAAAV